MFGLGNIVEQDEPDEDSDKTDVEMDSFIPAVTVESAAFSWLGQGVEPSLVIPSLHIPKGIAIHKWRV